MDLPSQLNVAVVFEVLPIPSALNGNAEKSRGLFEGRDDWRKEGRFERGLPLPHRREVQGPAETVGGVGEMARLKGPAEPVLHEFFLLFKSPKALNDHEVNGGHLQRLPCDLHQVPVALFEILLRSLTKTEHCFHFTD